MSGSIKSVVVSQGPAEHTVTLTLSFPGQLPAPSAVELSQELAMRSQTLPAVTSYKRLRSELANVASKVASLEGQRDAVGVDVGRARANGELMAVHESTQRYDSLEKEIASLKDLSRGASDSLQAARNLAEWSLRTEARDLLVPQIETARRQSEKASAAFLREAADEIKDLVEAQARLQATTDARTEPGQPHVIIAGALHLAGLVAGVLNQA